MITTGAISISQALMVNQTLLELEVWHNPITVDGARLIMKSAANNGICEYVSVNGEYEDDEVKKMEAILYDRRRQNVRNYVV